MVANTMWTMTSWEMDGLKEGSSYIRVNWQLFSEKVQPHATTCLSRKPYQSHE